MVPSEALQMSDSIRAQAVEQPRIGVTELARGTAWRKKLAESKILEIVDRGSTAGWLLSKEGMSSLLDTISYFESETERTQVAYLVETRASRDDWKSGDDLQRAIDDEAESILNSLKAAFDVD